MSKTWLRSNPRVSCLGAIPLAGVLALGIAMTQGWIVSSASAIGVVFVLLGVVLLAIWVAASIRPRLAHDDGFLLVYLTPYRPIRVPIDVVECFFMGQGPSHLSGRIGSRSQTTNVVVRLAERAEQWKHVDVWPLLGQWCDGYITVRGAWCEPLNLEVVQRLNRQLAETKRSRKV